MSGRCTVILSTHIVEDISQSCNDLAVINLGQVLFRGNPRQIIENVRGKVWHVTTGGNRPGPGVEIISTMQTQNGTQYRVVGEYVEGWPAISAEPSLEDGYIWLMQQARPDQITGNSIMEKKF